MKKFIVANWKMIPLRAEAKALVEQLTSKVLAATNLPQIVICPPYPYLTFVQEMFSGAPIALGAQDCSSHEEGSFTGEVSVTMLKECGCQYVIIGHSERRHYHQESEEILRQKVEQALKQDLTVIFCVGESKLQRENEETYAVIKRQLEALPEKISHAPLVIAYEPVWAIGTGLTASFDDIKNAHDFIKGCMKKIEQETPVLYGGSVTGENAQEILSLDNVDGVLVGRASLNMESFWKICVA